MENVEVFVRWVCIIWQGWRYYDCTEVSIEDFWGFWMEIRFALSMKWTWKEGGTNCWRTTTIRPYIRIKARNCVRKWLFLLGFPLVWTINLSVWYLFWLFKYLLICLFLLAHAHFLVNMCQKNPPFFVAWNRASRAVKSVFSLLTDWSAWLDPQSQNCIKLIPQDDSVHFGAVLIVL